MSDLLKSYAVSDGITQVRSPYGTGFVNFYVAQGTGGIDLVDTGADWPGSREALTELFAGIHPQGVRAVRRIYLTHGHGDHLGLAGWLQSETGAACLATAGEIDYVHRRRHLTIADLQAWLARQGTPADLSQRMAEGYPRLTGALPELTPITTDTVEIGAGAWRVLPTPGHSPAHVCFLEESPRRLLFGGDFVFAVSPPNVGLVPCGPETPLRSYLTSLAAGRQLPVSLVLPGHGQPFGDFQGVVGHTEATMARRQEAVLAAVAGEGRTPFQLAARFFATPSGSVPRLSGVGRALAHLQFLAAKGLVEERDGRWVQA